MINAGFDGIVVKKGEKYYFSMFTKTLSEKGGKIKICLNCKDGKEIAQATLSVTSDKWKKQNIVLTATANATDAVLAIVPQNIGKYGLDMISLFPQKTFKGRKTDCVPTLHKPLLISIHVLSVSPVVVWRMATE